MSGEKIQVREGWWRQRCGDVVWVWRNNNDLYPWSSRHNSYTHDGAVIFRRADSQDLVEFIGKNITITAAD